MLFELVGQTIFLEKLTFKEIKENSHETIMGTTISFDKDGTSEGSFVAYAFLPHKYSFVKKYFENCTEKDMITCDHYLIKV